MSSLEVWPEVQEAIRAGDAVVVSGPENSYVLDGLGDALITGPGAVGNATSSTWRWNC